MVKSFLGVRNVSDSTKVKLQTSAKLLGLSQADVLELAIREFFENEVKHSLPELLKAKRRRV